MGCYVYGPTVIYGTGYYYRPWYGAYYYPRPVTYGFGVHYNPYTGWSLSFGMTFGGPNAWFHVGWGGYPAHRGWWGPVGYHAGYRHGYYHGRAAGYASGYRRGYYDAKRDNLRRQYNRNAYKNQRSGIRQPTVNRNLQTRRATNKLNNVYADKNGRVYKQSKNGWQKREKNNWSSTQSNRSSSFKKRERDLNKVKSNRSRGASRTKKFQSSGRKGRRG
jgi:hypothetical protein